MGAGTSPRSGLRWRESSPVPHVIRPSPVPGGGCSSVSASLSPLPQPKPNSERPPCSSQGRQLNPRTSAVERKPLKRFEICLLSRWRWARHLSGCVDTMKYRYGPTMKSHRKTPARLHGTISSPPVQPSSKQSIVLIPKKIRFRSDPIAVTPPKEKCLLTRRPFFLICSSTVCARRLKNYNRK